MLQAIGELRNVARNAPRYIGIPTQKFGKNSHCVKTRGRHGAPALPHWGWVITMRYRRAGAFVVTVGRPSKLYLEAGGVTVRLIVTLPFDSRPNLLAGATRHNERRLDATYALLCSGGSTPSLLRQKVHWERLVSQQACRKFKTRFWAGDQDDAG